MRWCFFCAGLLSKFVARPRYVVPPQSSEAVYAPRLWFDPHCNLHHLHHHSGRLRFAGGQDRALVGRGPAGEPSFTPVNQVLTPYGQQVDLPGLRPQALALSPNGRLLAVSGKTNQLLIIDPETGAIMQTVSMPAESELTPLSQRATPPSPSDEMLVDVDKSGKSVLPDSCSPMTVRGSI